MLFLGKEHICHGHSFAMDREPAVGDEHLCLPEQCLGQGQAGAVLPPGAGIPPHAVLKLHQRQVNRCGGKVGSGQEPTSHCPLSPQRKPGVPAGTGVSSGLLHRAGGVVQSPFCVRHNRGRSRGCGSSSAPLLPQPGPPWMSLQAFRASQAELDPHCLLQSPVEGLSPLSGPSLSRCQRQPWSCSSALRLVLAALCRGRDSGSKFSLMERLYFLFRALLPAVMAPALPPAPQGLSA